MNKGTFGPMLDASDYSLHSTDQAYPAGNRALYPFARKALQGLDRTGGLSALLTTFAA